MNLGELGIITMFFTHGFAAHKVELMTIQPRLNTKKLYFTLY